MAWSTRQVADLAGTTVKAVRHYHGLGLLDEPERAGNGYKQYGVEHLIRLLQITRLRDLGLPLSRIGEMGHARAVPDDAIHVIDAEIAATIERLQRVRGELAALLRDRAPIDVPAGFGDVADGLSDTDRKMLLLYSSVVDEPGMADLRAMMATRDPIDDEFDALPADADDATIQSLAERMAPGVAAVQAAHPAVRDLRQHPSHSTAQMDQVIAPALAELYSAAQLDVLRRVNEILAAADAESADADEEARDE